MNPCIQQKIIAQNIKVIIYEITNLKKNDFF